MDRLISLKRLLGRDPTSTGIGSRERTVNECTVCSTEFDTSETTCPQCGSQIFRSKTTSPNAQFDLLVVVVVAGVAIVYNIVAGEYPREGPAA